MGTLTDLQTKAAAYLSFIKYVCVAYLFLVCSILAIPMRSIVPQDIKIDAAALL